MESAHLPGQRNNLISFHEKGLYLLAADGTVYFVGVGPN